MMLRPRRADLTIAILCALLPAGCDSGSSDSADRGQQPGVPLPEGLFLDSAPAGPTPIAQLKKTAKEGDQVLVHVVVGGRARPFVDNRAIMTVVEMTLPNQCTSPDDHCATPWDYCCAATEELKENLATVQINDDRGRPLKVDLPTSSPLAPMSFLLVRGTVGPRPDEQALVIHANGIYVDPAP